MPLNEERSSEVDIKRFMNQDVIVGSVENSPSLNRYAYVEGNPVNYLDPFGLEKWESVFKLQHELMSDFNNALMKLNLHVAILTMIFPEISGLTIPLLAFSNAFGIVFSGYDVLFYIYDLIDPENTDPEDRKAIREEIGWSLLSIALCSVPIKDFYYSLMYNFKDPLLEFIKEVYYKVSNTLQK